MFRVTFLDQFFALITNIDSVLDYLLFFTWQLKVKYGHFGAHLTNYKTHRLHAQIFSYARNVVVCINVPQNGQRVGNGDSKYWEQSEMGLPPN